MIDGDEYLCKVKGKLDLPTWLLHRFSPCCGWSRCSSFDYLLFLEMGKIGKGCTSFKRKH